MANNDLLDKVLEHIRHHQRAWDQGDWRRPLLDNPAASPTCGTAMCFAGWTVELAGREWAVPAKDLDEAPWPWRDSVLIREGEPWSKTIDLRDGRGDLRVISAASAALTLLDLDSADGDSLFSEKNDLLDLSEMVRLLKQGQSIEDYHRCSDCHQDNADCDCGA